MPYTPIVATLGYLLSPDGTQVLMIHRNARPGDQHLGKYNDPGARSAGANRRVRCWKFSAYNPISQPKRLRRGMISSLLNAWAMHRSYTLRCRTGSIDESPMTGLPWQSTAPPA